MKEYKAGLISIIIPVYNMEQYLRRCLDSIISNTYNNFEVICIDDGSGDLSDDIIKEYCRCDSRIKLISKPNGGVSSARNAGLEIAEGEYIAFIDADDWINPYYLEYLVHAITEQQAELAVCNYQETSGKFNWDYPAQVSSETIAVRQLLSWHGMKSCVWSKVYRHSAIHNIRFNEDMNTREDALFNFSLCTEHPNMIVAYVPLGLYAYFKRSGSLMFYVDENSSLQLTASYLSLYHNADNEDIKAILAREIIKSGLSARYVFLLKRDKINVKKCNHYMKQVLATRFEKKYLFMVMYYIPEVYRLYRIKDDRTLLTYEKNIKQR